MLAPALIAWLALSGCSVDAGGGGGEAPERPERPSKRAKRPAAPVTARGVDAPRAVVLVVLDTVRADHTSLCGAPYPTTPTLEALAARGAVHACQAYSPAPWTHPSHASLFTGLDVAEHGAIWVTDSAVAINPVTRVRPLDDGHTTLAERFRERGYQTVAVSANMIVTPASGLLQGFETVRVTPSSLGYRGRRLRPVLREVVRGLDPDRPLFLFLNLYDAHDPYPAVPEGAPWGPPQARVDLHPNQHDPARPYHRFVNGRMPPDEAAPFLDRIRRGYLQGVHEADAGLGFALRLLDDAGWLGDDFRLAVTSDHGELLGEHGLLRHGGTLWEPVVKVPLVYLDATADRQPTLPEPVSTVIVHDLLLDGVARERPVVAASERNERDIVGGVDGAAVWDGRRKGVCEVGGDAGWFHLADDPGELTKRGFEATDPLREAVAGACAGVEAVLGWPVPGEEGELERALRAVGYVE